MMWKLSLYILYATSFAFALVLADPETLSDNPPLNTCKLTIQSTVSEGPDVRSIIALGILYRFSISNPPVARFTIADGGTSDLFEELGNDCYNVGFSVKSKTYGVPELRDIVTKQWTGSYLFEYDVGRAGNFKVLSVEC